MDPIDLLRTCIPTLESHQIGYFVTGSVASALYGEFRNTNDIDVVIHLERSDVEVLCGCFPEPEFYVSRDTVLVAATQSRQFNVLHPASGFKIDFMVSDLSEFDRSRFSRARPITLGDDLVVMVASPEDVILKKLAYFKSGGSDKHVRDIAGILRVLGDQVDREYILHWAERLGWEPEWRAARLRADGRP